jgi:hypothetical protein
MIVTRHLILGTCTSAFYYNTIGLLYILWILRRLFGRRVVHYPGLSLRDHLNYYGVTPQKRERGSGRPVS